jgi:hypothetical protein
LHPDELFNRLFAGAGSHRDRALVALWSRPERAPRSCSALGGDGDPVAQLVTVVRKGSRGCNCWLGPADAPCGCGGPPDTLEDDAPVGRDDPPERKDRCAARGGR